MWQGGAGTVGLGAFWRGGVGQGKAGAVRLGVFWSGGVGQGSVRSGAAGQARNV
ncbi:MAG: hypothetical protein GQ468_02775 [Candidatus Scalindua sp.]|nr:hypothetical protein [Candidatus Scalindua sp.]